MQKTTTARAALNMDRLIQLSARNDEQFYLYDDGEHIGALVEGVPQPDTGAPVAVLISARRLKWLEDRSGKLRDLTGE
ncbi:hypothetical protein DOC35_19395 [Salmonella enterica subsp. enterica]|nr:hypothetical protein [Salmonella enterica subsp. enterica]